VCVSYTLIVSHRAGELILLYSSDKVRHPDGQKSEKIAIKRKVPPPAEKRGRQNKNHVVRISKSYIFPDNNSRVADMGFW